MPAYEMALVLSATNRATLAENLKRNLLLMMKHGAIVKSVDNAGLRRLPNVMRRNDVKHVEGHYFIVHTEQPGDIMKTVQKFMGLDLSVIKSHSCRAEDPFVRPCSLPDAEECHFGEITNPNYEKTARREHGFRLY